MPNAICFHGKGQSPDIFKSLLKSLENNMKDYIFIYQKCKYQDCFQSLAENRFLNRNYSWYNENLEDKLKDIQEFEDKLDSNTILIGFSEGSCFALELAQFHRVKGVIAISPCYPENSHKTVIIDPVILITSINDCKLSKKYAKKWKKKIPNLTEISHNKGHKVYLPIETRNIIIRWLKSDF